VVVVAEGEGEPGQAPQITRLLLLRPRPAYVLPPEPWLAQARVL
jgi:hypothetical protein